MNVIVFALSGIGLVFLYLVSVELLILYRKCKRKNRYRKTIARKMQILAQLEKELEPKKTLLEKAFLPNFGYNSMEVEQ
ncbi:hypothetical protein COY27_07035 [Candidatus Woesearchaeota archaeon CG_4_10_14_0_2_um_filter_33_13]|nr:MAG: hypothetical protein COY27_07035 [Candidatus Woesearchaeota archaeon CG_4_10_14_0_2_um_filter_33_13]